MAAPRNRKHILVPAGPRVDSYTPHRPKIRRQDLAPSIGRPAHGLALKAAIQQVEAEGLARRGATAFPVHGASPGLYVEFEGAPGIPLSVASLEDRRKGVEVVAVTETPSAAEGGQIKSVQRATVFVPDGQVHHFVERFEAYALTAPKKDRERRYEDMGDRIAALRLATLRALWTDDAAAYPAAGQSIWWEVWLRKTDGRELERIHEFADQLSLQLAERRFEFEDRIVVLIYGTAETLSSSLDVLNDFAELRRAKELATFFVDQVGEEQAAWSADLGRRLMDPPRDAPAVCVLDTGVTQAHPLIARGLATEDVHAANPEWGRNDDGGGPGIMGHGTEMAGLALYGDLSQVLPSQEPLVLRHRLESVKILPPPRFGANHPDLYGAITATAVSYPEVQAPDRLRVFSMAITADDQRDRGQPTSWSAALDALAAGRAFDVSKQGLVYIDDDSARRQRLFVISAGNVSLLERDHLARSDLEAVQDPAQAWNALSVGAYTDRAVLQDSRWESWQPLAAPGDLSPFSTTSLLFGKPWPVKPDVVFEGGNAAINGNDAVEFPVGDLSLLTTYFRPSEKQFVLTWATSAACAQAARLCAQIAAEYPSYWPETIRALVVHSAEWTPAMRRHFGRAGGKRARIALVRRYGFGVPNAERALRSASDSLTLIVQGVIRPFQKGKMREMHLFELPWPKSVLEALGETPVQMRVTLSYFVEPNPARRGWQRRHRYPSHGLRFEVKGAVESTDELRKRLNQLALEEEESPPSTGADDGWYLGDQARTRGSLHSDIWTGTAADLAERGVIAVYPVTGWWKEMQNRDRSENGARYALVVSIETPSVAADIWTPVAQQVGVAVEEVVEV